jgi:hypothetical protein
MAIIFRFLFTGYINLFHVTTIAWYVHSGSHPSGWWHMNLKHHFFVCGLCDLLKLYSSERVVYDFESD